MFKENNYNLLASDMMSINRTLPDYRYSECKLKRYASKLPSASIVIIFTNEPASLLLRTIWSIIHRSPKELLKEFILVDDVSDTDFIKNNLTNYAKSLPVRTIVLRSPKRLGLIRARVFGAKRASVLSLIYLHLGEFLIDTEYFL